MAEQAERRKADRRIVHCLVCHRPQENLPVHLARKCLKNSTPEQIASEVQKAKESSKQWMLRGRTWDHSHICAILPDPRSRQNLVGELLSRGFFVTDLPQEPGTGGLAEEADDTSGLRESPSMDEPPSIEDCQQVLRVARPDFITIQSDLQTGTELSDTDKTKYRYWCEALLVFRHMQRPADVEALTDSEWLNRIPHGGRVVIGVRRHKNVSMQIALTQEEESFLQLYFTRIRPGNIHPEKFNSNFFLSPSGERVHSVTRDMARFLEMYNLYPYTSRDVRRAVVRMATQKLSEHQQEAVRRYLNPTVVRPQDVVETAVLLDSSVGSASTSLEGHTPLPAQREAETSTSRQTSKGFTDFLKNFPVQLDGKPPTKKQRMDSGFPTDRVYYDKWRSSQYDKRIKYLLSNFTLRKPSAGKVARLIEQEGWKVNNPKPDEIIALWKPAAKLSVETDPILIRCVSEQSWTGLAIKDFGPEQGQGVVATQTFSKGDIVCDYHGKIITAAEGRDMMEGIHGEPGYLFFFKEGKRELCIDAQTFPCECHPEADTVGRRINHSSKMANIKPFQCVISVDGQEKHVILFKALKDITVGTQLKYDYGVRRTSFRGEGLDLAWLDE